ncbi:MAG TPA: DNA polymerase III subunit gamma/tau [Candidatus Limnocylindria bacterium]|nr:DNA polymerase III subunit gamma/tau [Candidatus Limnocylindria bacterium]
MGRALYRKYRSKKLSEIVGQEHVTTALSNALKTGRIGHAYLFTGPRGTGKTSIARILAHEVNGLPYDENATHLDIIEIDAASNRRIDEIRTLRERVHNAPTSAKYKVYIIDEVHMLTKEAFNALLKTLEEPPDHVIFILATTEAHKLPETIISRTQRYTFKPAEQTAAARLLQSIAASEGIDISDEALGLVAAHGRGSFRDSVSLLDQIGNTGGRIGLDEARRALGIAPDEAIQDILAALAAGPAAELLQKLQTLHDQGFQAPQLAKQLSQNLRQKLLAGEGHLGSTAATQLMQRLIDVPAAHDPTALLELVLLEPVLARTDSEPAPPTVEVKVANQQSPVAGEKQQPGAKKTAPTEDRKDKTKATKAQEIPQKEEPTEASPEAGDKNQESPAALVPLDEAGWQQVLQMLKQKHNTLYGVARMAVPIIDGDKLTLAFSFPFHQKRMNDAKNKQIISEFVRSHTGTSMAITCIVEKKAGRPSKPTPQEPAAPDTPSDAPLDTISNIFGGGEVLE